MDAELYAYPAVERPWLRTNFVSTVDGAAYDADGVTASLGGDADHEVFQLLRRLADVVIVGAGTARIEKYGSSRTPLALVKPECLISQTCLPGSTSIGASGRSARISDTAA